MLVCSTDGANHRNVALRGVRPLEVAVRRARKCERAHQSSRRAELLLLRVRRIRVCLCIVHVHARFRQRWVRNKIANIVGERKYHDVHARRRELDLQAVGAVLSRSGAHATTTTIHAVQIIREEGTHCTVLASLLALCDESRKMRCRVRRAREAYDGKLAFLEHRSVQRGEDGCRAFDRVVVWVDEIAAERHVWHEFVVRRPRRAAVTWRENKRTANGRCNAIAMLRET